MVAEFKWGVKKYPPRNADSVERDNGMCFYTWFSCKDTVRPASINFQIKESDVGDIWLIDQTTIIVDGVRSLPKNYHRIKNKNHDENPTGEWNKLKLIANNGKIKYFVNRLLVNEGDSPNVLKGKI